MKELSLLVFVTQLGLSVAVPLGGFIFLGIWLRQRFDLGIWVVLVGIGLGLICAIESLLTTLKALSRISRKNKDDSPPPVSFNDHQ